MHFILPNTDIKRLDIYSLFSILLKKYTSCILNTKYSPRYRTLDIGVNRPQVLTLAREIDKKFKTMLDWVSEMCSLG